MKSLHSWAAAFMLAAPLLSYAQPTLPTFNRDAVTNILNRTDVQASKAELKKLDLSRVLGIRNLGFEDGSTCVTPMPIAPVNVDMHRSLFVHDAATLNAGNFSLRRTLQKLKDDVNASVPGATPESIFVQLWDTQNDTPNQVTAGNAHCSDNNGKVNGFPHNACPRPEGIEATGAPADITNRINNDYKPIALVNRLDLADKGWKNCGEHRIVYGKLGGGIAKNLIIFEAVLPNPKPGCRSGCRDVIEFWVELSNDADPVSRAAKLENFFYNGLSGFRPVVHTNHYSSGVSSVYGGSGSGQIRTNQFLTRAGMDQRWTLKEFKTLLSCAGGVCDYDIVPTSVKVNPYGLLWNRDVATGAVVPALPAANSYATAIAGLPALATTLQADVLAQVTADRLANPDINSITYEVKPTLNAAESQSQSPTIDHYPNQFAAAADATFRNNLQSVAAGFGLTGQQIVNRAMANSCAGCHLPSGFGLTNANAIGPGMSWPNALAFVHVDPPLTSIAAQAEFDVTKFGGNTQGFNISPALLTEFLPARRNNLVNLANGDVCDCVRKPGPMALNRTFVERHKAILAKSDQQVKDQLATVRKSFVAKSSVNATDVRDLLQQQKAVIAKAEAARNAELAQAGLQFETPVLKPEAVKLSDTRLPADRLRALKAEKVRELVNAEPPRETITGSFRAH